MFRFIATANSSIRSCHRALIASTLLFSVSACGTFSQQSPANDKPPRGQDLSTSNLISSLSQLSPELKSALPEAESSPQPRNAVKANFYETLESNYADVFEEYEDMDQSILVFPNDSLRLGDANKLIIEQYVEAMNPETDLMSVIGCSHGNTNVSNGNSLLALGRANRVKEALLFSGLEHDSILEEGCWASETFDDVMPRRGVVLTLKRRKNPDA